MSTRETSITTETADDGTEVVTEISETLTQTAADGTETEVEVTTSQGDDDDPSTIEQHVVVTETAADGTETVYEVTTTEVLDGETTDTDESSEGIIEALFDPDVDSDADSTELSAGGTVNDDTETLETTDEVDDGVELSDLPVDPGVTPVEAVAFESSVGVDDVGPSAVTESSTESDAAAEAGDLEAHSQAATDAQHSADDFIAQGDYAAAAEAREVAENEAWEAGDTSMLSAYDSSDLANSAEKQDDVQYYEAQEAAYAQAGDYEHAREAADNAGYANNDADSGAGGADHSGQADTEKYEMDWAIHEEKQADYYADNAAAYAADGDLENAQRNADQAVDHQAAADHYGDLGEHGGDIAAYDPSADVAAGGGYESTYDTGHVDTSYDAGVVDTSYDPGTSDV